MTSLGFETPERELADQLSPAWWIFLVVGVAWLTLSLIVFRFDVTSAKSIGVLAGIVFLAASVVEVGAMAGAQSTLMKIFRGILAAVLAIGGILAVIHPGNAFVTVASITGFMFVAVGVFDVIVALAERGDGGIRWLRLVNGLIAIGLGFWASGDFYRSSILLVVYVGLFALLRGISSIVFAFTLRHERRTPRGA